MKCIENIFYLLFSAEWIQKTWTFFHASVPLMKMNTFKLCQYYRLVIGSDDLNDNEYLQTVANTNVKLGTDDHNGNEYLRTAVYRAST